MLIAQNAQLANISLANSLDKPNQTKPASIKPKWATLIQSWPNQTTLKQNSTKLYSTQTQNQIDQTKPNLPKLNQSQPNKTTLNQAVHNSNSKEIEPTWTLLTNQAESNQTQPNHT